MKFTSTQNTTNLKDFIEKIPSRGIPSKVTITYLVGLGYKSNNDRTIVTVLKSIGLVESNGTPSPEYKKMRSDAGKKNLADLIRKTYSGLFEIYTDANKQSEDKLKDYFASVTTVGDASLRNIIKTFQALCSIADFAQGSAVASPVNQHVSQPTALTPPTQASQHTLPAAQGQNTSSSQVHINIQVHIPGEQSPETYESIFKNLGKYVLGIKEGSE